MSVDRIKKKSPIAAPTSENRSIPFNCSMPYSEFVKLEKEAARLGISRSKLLRKGMEFYYHYSEPKASDG